MDLQPGPRCQLPIVARTTGREKVSKGNKQIILDNHYFVCRICLRLPPVLRAMNTMSTNLPDDFIHLDFSHRMFANTILC